MQITSSQLRAIAGPTYARGEAYFRDGRVQRCVADGDAIDGLVVGTARYQVRVSAHGGALVADCTCPVQDAFCKHAVALLLHHLGGAPAAPAAAAHDMFATRAELEQWAAQHAVAHALEVAADCLLDELGYLVTEHYWLRGMLARMALGDVASHEGACRYARDAALHGKLARAAYARLHREAACVATGIAEERDRAPAATDPAIAPLWARLVELRREVRAHAAPRSRATRERGAWACDASAALVTWKERHRVYRSREYTTAAVATRLAFPSSGAPRLECACDPRDAHGTVRGTGARCTHALALIDSTLDLLEDPARADEARRIADHLLRPGWARALDELDRFEAAAARPRTAIEVWWHVEHELGALELTPLVRKQTRRGALSAGARMSAARLLEEHREQLAETDLRIAEHVASWAPASRAAGTYPVRAFAALVGHPRAYTDSIDEPLEVVRRELGFTALESGELIRLEPALGGARFSPRLLAALLPLFAPGEPLIVLDGSCCTLVDITDDARRLWQVIEKHGDAFPPESHGRLLDRLASLDGRLPLAVPATLKGRQLAADAATVVRLRLLPDVTLELELFVRPAAGAPLFHPGAGPRDVLIARDGERGYVRRDLDGEPARARAALDALAIEGAEEGPPACFRLADPEAALRLVTALAAPPPGLEVEWIDRPPVIARSPGLEALRVSVERKRDWFGISGELAIETGRIELAVLLDAARRQRRFVRVDERRWVELSDLLRKRLLAVADQTFASQARLELSPGAVPAIRALADDGARVTTAPAWDLLAERLASATALRPRPPAALAGTLRDYQIAGHAWLSRIAAWGAGACLADDMGLGKTVQAIAVLLDRSRLGPALVLAPTSVAYNWVAELARFAPTLRPILYTEADDRAAVLGKLRKKDVVIASYGLLVRDGARFAATRFATLVLDEAQALKNPTTRRARAARTLDADFRIALSGTPLENHLGELWSLFAIVFPGLLGSWEQFRERFAFPIERAKDPEARAALARVLRPFLLRRTKPEVARELPARTEVEVPIALSEEERALYDDARLAALAELGALKGVRDEQRRFQVLAALTRLRLLACHPRLYDPTSKVASSKLRRLVELVDELRSEGHRALVFSQFTSHLALARDELARAGASQLYLDGATPAAERARLIAAFQDGAADVFLISLKAGGTGINLTAADYVIHLDPWWNPAVEDQATDRAHRIGQTRAVTVYRLIARGTIEDQIVALHRDKRALVAGILDGSDAAARLTARDLLTLLQTR